ncbi:MAG: YdbL family protein [Nitrospira sp.]|nr:YdbL family protein [Nitrospira sp.]
MSIGQWAVIGVMVAVIAGGPLSAHALSLDEAKAKGLVGEKSSGYLGAVSGEDEVHALVREINAKRRQAYEEIAQKNGTHVTAVETLAGQKAIQNTKPGHHVEGPNGWIKK